MWMVPGETEAGLTFEYRFHEPSRAICAVLVLEHFNGLRVLKTVDYVTTLVANESPS